MVIELFLALFLGFIAGVITGIIPGIHINLISSLILYNLAILLLKFNPLVLAFFITSMTIVHTFFDFLPTCYLSLPDSSSSLSVRPAHKLLLKGRGYEATKFSLLGNILGILSVSITSPLIFLSYSFLYDFLKPYIVYILILISIAIIIRSGKPRIFSFALFCFAGVLGIVALTIPDLNQPLLPLLTGLFGTSNLILTIRNKAKIPKQSLETEKLEKKELAKVSISNLFASALLGFLPGITSSESAALSSVFFKKIKITTYLMLVSAAQTAMILTSFIAVLAIDKARSGSVVAIQQILPDLTLKHLVMFLAIPILLAIPSYFLTLYFSKKASVIITKVNYTKLAYGILTFITLLVFFISGPLGLLVLVSSTSLGVIPSLTEKSQSLLIGSLILPIILFLLL